jgi:hypothetical protein
MLERDIEMKMRRNCPYSLMIQYRYLLMIYYGMAVILTRGESSIDIDEKKYVYVYHFMVNHWGTSHEGIYHCDKLSKNLHCEWTHADHIATLRDRYYGKNIQYHDNHTVSLALYNIHSWWEKMRWVHPANCELPTNLTMAESEESRVRYNSLFEPSFRNFDGISTTSPTSAVQRVYHEAFLYELNLTKPFYNFTSLVKGGSYVASDCHRRDAANSNRDGVVYQLRMAGVRVDGLGRCMRSYNAEGISLPHTPDARYNLDMKRNAIGRYLFHMAFENSLEAGYITEKPFDALIAGTVPVYLGDHETLRALLPDPKAAIFVADFQGNMSALAEYLNYLTINETAYEEHRAWRNTFHIDDYHNSKDLLRYDWECRICHWAATAVNQINHPPPVCNSPVTSKLNLSEYEGKAIKGGRRVIYFVVKGQLRPIPDFDTFLSLNLDLKNVVVVSDEVINSLPIGEQLPRHVPA